jgi:protein-disulfide isomerase
MGRFEAAITSGEYEAVVEKDFREGQDAGISSTPSFIINGRVLVGPQPLETFEQVIEEEARKAEGG